MRKPKPKRHKPKGFAAMSPEAVLRIATMGGKTISRNRKHMAEIGRIGGKNSVGQRKKSRKRSVRKAAKRQLAA